MPFQVRFERRYYNTIHEKEFVLESIRSYFKSQDVKVTHCIPGFASAQIYSLKNFSPEEVHAGLIYMDKCLSNGELEENRWIWGMMSCLGKIMGERYI